jgi:histidine triad (HIT) family protein
MNDCIFCKIANGEIPTDKIYETDKLVAFKDISPKAPVHILIVPKEHITSAAELGGREDISGAVFNAVAHLYKELNLDNGFRVVTNCGKDGRQSVGHLHFHLLAGKPLSEDM